MAREHPITTLDAAMLLRPPGTPMMVGHTNLISVRTVICGSQRNASDLSFYLRAYVTLRALPHLPIPEVRNQGVSTNNWIIQFSSWWKLHGSCTLCGDTETLSPYSKVDLNKYTSRCYAVCIAVHRRMNLRSLPERAEMQSKIRNALFNTYLLLLDRDMTLDCIADFLLHPCLSSGTNPQAWLTLVHRPRYSTICKL